MESTGVAKRPTSIQLILNTPDDRLTPFKETFEWLVKKGYGKMTPSHFIINTDVMFKPNNKEAIVFMALQDDAFRKGFKMNCFCFNINV